MKFNLDVPNKAGVKYFSIGSSTLPTESSRLFAASNKIIALESDVDLVTDNDGVFSVDEMKWSNYLLTFEGDHADVAGLSYSLECMKIAEFIRDNLYHEFSESFDMKKVYLGDLKVYAEL